MSIHDPNAITYLVPTVAELYADGVVPGTEERLEVERDVADAECIGGPSHIVPLRGCECEWV